MSETSDGVFITNVTTSLKKGGVPSDGRAVRPMNDEFSALSESLMNR